MNPYNGPSMPLGKDRCKLIKLQWQTTAMVPEDEVWAWLDDGWTRVESD